MFQRVGNTQDASPPTNKDSLAALLHTYKYSQGQFKPNKRVHHSDADAYLHERAAVLNEIEGLNRGSSTQLRHLMPHC